MRIVSELALGQQLGVDVVDSGGAGDVVGGSATVSGDHSDVQAEFAQGSNGNRCAGAESVFSGEPAGILAVDGDVEKSCAGWGVTGKSYAELFEEGAISGGNQTFIDVAVDGSGNAFAGDGLDIGRGLPLKCRGQRRIR